MARSKKKPDPWMDAGRGYDEEADEEFTIQFPFPLLTEKQIAARWGNNTSHTTFEQWRDDFESVYQPLQQSINVLMAGQRDRWNVNTALKLNEYAGFLRDVGNSPPLHLLAKQSDLNDIVNKANAMIEANAMWGGLLAERIPHHTLILESYSVNRASGMLYIDNPDNGWKNAVALSWPRAGGDRSFGVMGHEIGHRYAKIMGGNSNGEFMKTKVDNATWQAMKREIEKYPGSAKRKWEEFYADWVSANLVGVDKVLAWMEHDMPPHGDETHTPRDIRIRAIKNAFDVKNKDPLVAMHDPKVEAPHTPQKKPTQDVELG